MIFTVWHWPDSDSGLEGRKRSALMQGIKTAGKPGSFVLEETGEMHPCPSRSDVNNDPSPFCYCNREMERICADDI